MFSLNNFAEDLLPVGQSPIHTQNVKRLRGFIRLITDKERRYSTMGTVTGMAGIGKSVAIQAYCDNLPRQEHTGLPQAVKIKVKPRSTPKAFALDIVKALNDKPRGTNVYQVADEAAAALVRNDLILLIVDEADRLNEDSFEVLRHIHDQSGCGVVVVGLPSILSVIDRHEKFASRIGLRMEFLPLETQEVIQVVLPQLVFPRWKFTGESDEEWAMGEQIWKMVRPSMRNLRNLLQTASQLAEYSKESVITMDIIKQAFDWTATTADKQRLKKEQQVPNVATSYEAESERRQQARQK